MKFSLSILIFAFLLMSCEDTIDVTLNDVPSVTVVDAWINNLSEPQKIILSQTQPYFNSSEPQRVSGAQVSIEDNDGNIFQFVENAAKEYVWEPAVGERFGQVGGIYDLTITLSDEVITSRAEMGRVPVIDSVNFSFEEADAFIDTDYFLSEFFARDPVDVNDTYWIKSYKNGEFLNKPAEINIAYDAGFSAGGPFDGVYFIQPLRNASNPFDTDEDGAFIPPYADGDSVYIEIHSISNDAFKFLNELKIQTDRPGGFAELFAAPLFNVRTNIESTNDTNIIGFFNVAAISGMGKKLDVSEFGGG